MASGIFGFVLVVWVALGMVCGVLWDNKGGNFVVGFLLGLVLGVIGLVIVAVATPGGTSRQAGLSGSRATITWTHTGFRYLLGFMAEPPIYGIWDRQAPGPPVFRYPYSEHGKSESLAKFRQLEPNGTEVATPPLLPPPPVAPAGGQATG